MAIAHSVITGDHATGYSADAPCLYASRRGAAGRWNTDGNPATADASDTDYPAVSAWDGDFAVVTRPNAQAAIWWYVLTLDTSVVDAIMYHPVEWGFAGGGGEIDTTVYLSDGTTDHQAVGGGYSEVSPLRWFAPQLRISGDGGDTQRRFTGVVYMKLKFQADAGTCRPQLTELSAGRARQLMRRPQYREHDRARTSGIREHIARSGRVTGVVDYAGAKVLNETIRLGSSDQADVIDSWWADTGYGARKSVWCPRPKSAHTTWWLMNHPGKAYDPPRVSHGTWEARLRGVEDGSSLAVDE